MLVIKHTGGQGEGEPEGKRGRGLGRRVKAVGGWVLRVAVELFSPGTYGLKAVEEQVGALVESGSWYCSLLHAYTPRYLEKGLLNC
jgi:hypothetical protein